MKPGLSEKLDKISEWTGSVTKWFILVMVLVAGFNALARYLSRYLGIDLSSNALYELQWYLFSIVFLTGASWALKENAHVRVDVLQSRFSERKQLLIEIAGHMLFLIPFCILGIVTSLPSVYNSWATLEMSPDPGGLARFPIKTIVPAGFALLLIQAVSELLKCLYKLKESR